MVDTPEKPLVVTPHTDVTKRRSDWGGEGPPQRKTKRFCWDHLSATIELYWNMGRKWCPNLIRKPYSSYGSFSSPLWKLSIQYPYADQMIHMTFMGFLHFTSGLTVRLMAICRLSTAVVVRHRKVGSVRQVPTKQHSFAKELTSPLPSIQNWNFLGILIGLFKSRSPMDGVTKSSFFLMLVLGTTGVLYLFEIEQPYLE